MKTKTTTKKQWMTATLLSATSALLPVTTFASDTEKKLALEVDYSVGTELVLQPNSEPSLAMRALNKPIALNEEIGILGQEVDLSARKTLYSAEPLSFHFSPASIVIAPVTVSDHATLGYQTARASLFGLTVGTEPEPTANGAVFSAGMRMGTLSQVQVSDGEPQRDGQSPLTLDHLTVGLQLVDQKKQTPSRVRSVRLSAGVRDVVLAESLKCHPGDTEPLALYQAEFFGQFDAHFKKGVYARAELGSEQMILQNPVTQEREVRKAHFLGTSLGVAF